MPRKRFHRREPPPPDALYNSVLVTRLINKMSYIGKKTKATVILHDAFEKIRENVKEDPLKVLEKAIENTRPLLETRPRQVGGATYQVPMEVPVYRSESRALRWIIEFARAKKGSPMHVRLADEITQASRREGAAFKKREETHKMAEANRAFAHYRW